MRVGWNALRSGLVLSVSTTPAAEAACLPSIWSRAAPGTQLYKLLFSAPCDNISC